MYILLWIIFLLLAGIGGLVVLSCTVTFILVKTGKVSWDWKFTNKEE